MINSFFILISLGIVTLILDNYHQYFAFLILDLQSVELGKSQLPTTA